VQALPAVLALVALCSCADDAGDNVDGSGSDLVAQFCVSETNRYRAMVPVAAVTESAALDTYAAAGARADTESGTPHGHFQATSGSGIASAENECPASLGWMTSPNPTDEQLQAKVAACIEAFWSEGPGADYNTHGHYINMTNAAYHTVGCGVYVDGTQLTITQDFGM
jgi:uncharacterized protein YkwD